MPRPMEIEQGVLTKKKLVTRSNRKEQGSAFYYAGSSLED
jgi:hypothetical protein